MPRRMKLVLVIAIDEKQNIARVVGWDKRPSRAKYVHEADREDLERKVDLISNGLNPDDTSFRYFEMEITRPADLDERSDIRLLDMTLITGPATDR